jgi:hypothetical protein
MEIQSESSSMTRTMCTVFANGICRGDYKTAKSWGEVAEEAKL